MSRNLLARSLLFVPGTAGPRIEKALKTKADAIIIDLEDSVALSEKAVGRAAVIEVLKAPRTKPIYVRINAVETALCFVDLNQVARARPDGIVLPKVEQPHDILTIHWLLNAIELDLDMEPGHIVLLPTIESAKGLAAAEAIAGASARVERLAFGGLDLGLDLGMDLADGSRALDCCRFAIAAASRSAGIPGPLDSAFVNIHDEEGFRASATTAKQFGFTGKGCIHPLQVSPANAVFMPSKKEVERAQKIVALFERSEGRGIAAIQIDGEMVDYPIFRRAQQILAFAAATAS
jgi:citrate lyase subunit beta / citryl-CoA lyase